MRSGQPIGSLGVALFVKAAADHPRLDPPFIRIDQKSGVAWHFGKQRCRFLVALEFAQVADLQIEIGRLIMPGGMNRRYGVGGLRRVADYFRPGPVKRLCPRFFGDDLGVTDVIAVKQHFHPAEMIVLAKQAVELAQEDAGVPVIHGDIAPEAGGNGAGAFCISRRHQGPDQDNGALGGFRCCLAEGS